MLMTARRAAYLYAVIPTIRDTDVSQYFKNNCTKLKYQLQL